MDAALPVMCPPGFACPQWGWCPTQPANVPAVEFNMMADVFGQMIGLQPPQYCPPPPCPAQMMMPPCGVMPSVYVPVPQAATAPTPMQQLSTPGTLQRSLIGTWYRELGSKQCVIKIAPDHFTMTITEANEIEDGKTVTASIVLTADYHLTRDGTTAVGLITSVDLKFEGDVPDEVSRETLGVLAGFQKSLEEKPFALSIRVYGDALVIGNVRMPEVPEDHLDVQPATLIGGRYKNAGNKPLPKLKVTKAAITTRYSDGPATLNLPLGEPFGSSTLPAGGPLPAEVPLPAGAPPGPPIPNGPPGPPYASPAPPVPTMPTPTPPGPIQEPKPGMMRKQFSDPSIQMEQMLYQSEDPQQINNVWRRFWFPDPPSHLAPERIHGGIR